MNVRQRVVVVVGLGVGLWFFGSWATSYSAAFGWVGYAPLSQESAPGAGLHPWVRLIIWLGLVFAWIAAALWLLRPRQGAE
jgi:heme/copper-type cytochrome/quinol oxidase subunit 1